MLNYGEPTISKLQINKVLTILKNSLLKVRKLKNLKNLYLKFKCKYCLVV